MMKKSFFAIAVFFLVSISVISGIANAFWIWTPETKKFTNPKYAVKDSPKEQFDWAMSFYNAKDFQRAATEFEKLAKQYEFSEHASKAQYYVGLCYENMNKYYLAYQNYQKAIDNFPHIANTEEILAREFAIGNLYLSKPGPKVLGTDIMAPLDRAVEIFKKIVENAPYGKFAAESQFKLGEALKKSERHEEAVGAFHKVVEDYPKSEFATKAMYEESQCAYKASLRPAYDAEATDNAIKTFEKFVDRNKDAKLAEKADATMRRLKDNVSEKSFKAAQFYEAQGKTEAAIIYYQDVLDTYPDSTFVERARARIEALRARTTKKVAAPVDPIKKKPKQVVRQKKSWNPFKSKSEKPRKKAETVAPKMEKKAWKPFSFKSEKKKADMAVTAAPIEKVSAKKKPWSLFNFGAKKEAVVKEASPKNKAWKPLSFDTEKPVKPKEVLRTPAIVETLAVQVEEEEIVTAPVETPVAEVAPETIETVAVESSAVEPSAQPLGSTAIVVEEKEVVAAQVKEAPKAKIWKPFNFDSKKAPPSKEPPVKNVEPKKKPWSLFNLGAKKEPVVKDATEKKAWKPFNFENKKDPLIEEVPKDKGWKPLYFGTNDEPMAATNRRW